MEFKDISHVKNDVLSSEKLGIAGNPSTEDFSDLGKEKIDALKVSIKEINELISSREKMSKQFYEDGELLKSEINKFILENDRIPLADQREIMREKNELRNKKVLIAESQLKEKIDSWKDIANLKKERRIYERELQEKEARVKMLNEFLKEDN
jgi:hypothetical protein